jgi:transposase
VIDVVESGSSARAAAQQFVIGISTAIRWAKRWRETGSGAVRSNRGQSRSPLKRHEEWLLDLAGREPNLTLKEIQRRLLDERPGNVRMLRTRSVCPYRGTSPTYCKSQEIQLKDHSEAIRSETPLKRE